MTPAPRVAVVGSANVDQVLRVPTLPRPGETTLVTEMLRGIGGKGANQAAAAARLGSAVTLIARVGDDADADLIRDGLRTAGVDVSHVRTSGGVPTGLAVVGIDAAGENSIMVASNANAELSARDVDDAATILREAAVTLVQLEVPDAPVRRAAEVRGGLLVLNPAPARHLDPALLSRVDVLVPNRGELATLLGEATPPDTPADVEALARRIDGPSAIVATLGADGVLVLADGIATHLPGRPVAVVDTTGAGDAFCGALGDGLAHGMPLLDAAARANAVAALATTRVGAQEAHVTRQEAEALLDAGG